MEKKQMRLDSSANIYPAIATSDYPQIYRLSVAVITAVVPEILEQAVRETLPFFPAFRVRLKKGHFWYSLEETESMPEIRKLLSRSIQPFPEKELMFRLLYEENWIHLEVFHALTDGSGSLHFLNAVCYRYCQLAYPLVLPEEARLKRYGLKGADKVQDAYLSISGQRGSFWKLLGQKRAFRIAGEKRRNGRAEILTVRIPLSDLRKKAGAYHATVCELLAA